MMRTDDIFRSSLKNITKNKDVLSQSVRKELSAPSNPSGIPSGQGRGSDGTSNGGGGGSIASPLTEVSRTYHADKLATSSDGLFSFHYANVHEINYTDANSSDVKLIFANP